MGHWLAEGVPSLNGDPYWPIIIRNGKEKRDYSNRASVLWRSRCSLRSKPFLLTSWSVIQSLPDMNVLPCVDMKCRSRQRSVHYQRFSRWACGRNHLLRNDKRDVDNLFTAAVLRWTLLKKGQPKGQKCGENLLHDEPSRDVANDCGVVRKHFIRMHMSHAPQNKITVQDGRQRHLR